MAIKIFLPLLSDHRPTMGMKMERDMENPEKMTPIQKPLAPRLSA